MSFLPIHNFLFFTIGIKQQTFVNGLLLNCFEINGTILDFLDFTFQKL
jgi:hypothetical protein